jgi:aryl-alcohol dehydrogenase-like predicted oxidoreductase
MNWYKTSQSDIMPKRSLGKTGYKVSIISLGGQGSLETQGDDDNCIDIIRRAYELGINYFDTSPIYGPSEDFYGKALDGIRNDIFLATKTDKRDRDGSLKEIEKSLKRLKTDHVDLWQIHHLDTMEEVNEVTAKDGALQALLEMKEQGVVKYCGFTGHQDPKILIEMNKRHDFDTVLCPVNAADCHMKPPFIDTVVKAANSKNIGVIGMKVFSQGFIFHPKGITTSWEPLAYSLSQPVSTLIVGHDNVAQLEENVAIAKNFSPLNEEKQKEIEEKTKNYIRRASFFRSRYGGYQSRDKLKDPFVTENAKV